MLTPRLGRLPEFTEGATTRRGLPALRLLRSSFTRRSGAEGPRSSAAHTPAEVEIVRNGGIGRSTGRGRHCCRKSFDLHAKLDLSNPARVRIKVAQCHGRIADDAKSQFSTLARYLPAVLVERKGESEGLDR